MSVRILDYMDYMETSINLDRSEFVNFLLKSSGIDLDSFLTIENLATIYNKVSFKNGYYLSRKYYFKFKAFSKKNYLNIGIINEIKNLEIKNFEIDDESGVEDFHKIAKAIITILDIDEFEQHIFNKITLKPVLIVIDLYSESCKMC